MAQSFEYSIASRRRPASRRLEALGQRVAAGVDDRRAGNAVQVVALDGVDEPGRRALARDEVVPPPGGHVARVRDAGQAGGDRVHPPEVVQQPAVKAILAERGLHCRDVERHEKRV